MLDRIFLEIFPSALLLEPIDALLLDWPWKLKFMLVISFVQMLPMLSAAVAPAELSPETFPEYAFGISRNICSKKGLRGPLAVQVAN